MHHVVRVIGGNGIAGSAARQIARGVPLPVLALAAHFMDFDAAMTLMNRAERCTCFDGLQLLRIADQHDLCASFRRMGQHALHLPRANHPR